jgi:hypothetical protein
MNAGVYNTHAADYKDLSHMVSILSNKNLRSLHIHLGGPPVHVEATKLLLTRGSDVFILILPCLCSVRLIWTHTGSAGRASFIVPLVGWGI